MRKCVKEFRRWWISRGHWEVEERGREKEKVETELFTFSTYYNELEDKGRRCRDP